MSYFPEPYSHGRNKIKVELDSPNGATKSYLEDVTGTILQILLNKVDLCSSKSNSDELDIDKSKTAPVDLSKISNLVKHSVVKKTVYDELFKTTNAIQAIYTNNLVKNIEHDAQIKDIEEKIPNRYAYKH